MITIDNCQYLFKKEYHHLSHSLHRFQTPEFRNSKSRKEHTLISRFIDLKRHLHCVAIVQAGEFDKITHRL